MRRMRKFFWLVIFLFVFVSYAAAVEITQVGKVVAPHPNTGEEFIILISDNFWNVPEIQEAVERYQDDVYSHRQVGSRVFMVSPAEIPFGPGSGCGGDIESAKEIREFLKSQYYDESPARLVGTILIGDLPWVNVKTPNYTFGISDAYFGELDFEGWTIVNQQECHYLELPYCDGGCIHPEIWIARIFPPVCFDFFLGTCYCPIGGFSFPERIETLVRFFEKDHSYYDDYYRDHHDFLAIDLVSDSGSCWTGGSFPAEVEDEVVCKIEETVSEFQQDLTYPWRMIDLYVHGGDLFSDGSFWACDVFDTEVFTPVILLNGCWSGNFDYENSLSEAYLFGNTSEVVSIIGLGTGTYPISVPFSLRYDYIGKAFKEVKCWEQDKPQAFLTIEGDPFVKVAKEMNLPLAPTFISTSWEEYPYRFRFSSKHWEARPLVVVPNGDWVELKLGFTGFKEPVDIYIGVDAQNSMGYFFVWTANGIICWDGNISSLNPYKRDWVNGVEEVLFSGNLNDLPSGDYYGYILVVSAGTDMSSFDWNSSTYYLWSWHWQK